MVVLLGQMQLPAPQDPDPSDDYFNGTISGGGLWTALTRSSDHDHTGGVNGKPISIASIPDGSITTSKLDPSVLLPYALVDGSKPFTGQVTMQADAVVRDRLFFGEQGTALPPDAWWERAGVNRLRTDSNVGVGVAPAAWGAGSRALQLGQGAVLAGLTATMDAALQSNTYHDGSGQKALVAGLAGSLSLGADASLRFANAPTAAAGAAQTFTNRLWLDPGGTLALGGAAPAPWAAGWRALQLGATSLVAVDGLPHWAHWYANSIYDGAWKAVATGASTHVRLADGGLSVLTSPSVAAGGAQTPTARLSVAQTGTTTLSADAGQAHLASGAGQRLTMSTPGIVVGPLTDNTTYSAFSDARWVAVYAVAGTINTSLAEAKEGVTPLSPEDALAAVRATDPVVFDYRPPERGPEWYELPDDPEQAHAVLLQRMKAAPLEEAARHQAGFVLSSPDFSTDPLFETGEGQSNAANTAGILLAAIKALDTRLTTLEGA